MYIIIIIIIIIIKGIHTRRKLGSIPPNSLEYVKNTFHF